MTDILYLYGDQLNELLLRCIYISYDSSNAWRIFLKKREWIYYST